MDEFSAQQIRLSRRDSNPGPLDPESYHRPQGLKVVRYVTFSNCQNWRSIKIFIYSYNGSQSIRTQVNSYSSQFVNILVNSYSNFWSIRTHLVNSYSCLVNSYSFWSIRTHFGQFVLKLK